MLIKVDMREADLIKYIQGYLARDPFLNEDIQIKIEALPIGDIILCKNDEELLIIERKSINDLMASIKDGRYEEQSYRLDGSTCPNHNIVYLIEGDARNHKDKQTIYSALCSIHYYKGFSTMRAFSLDETAYMICNMAYKINKSQTRVGYYCLKENKIEKDNNYCSVVKKVKKDNITPENIGEIMLCQIPGVSSTIAKTICNQFKTMSLLIRAIQENDACLDNIGTTDAKNKFRKMSKTTKENIIRFLKV